MRRFSSYGPVNPKLHYYVPREALINKACTSLIGENPSESGHYITVWAPRQTGKSWLLRETLFQVRKDPQKRFDIIKINLEDQKDKTNVPEILQSIAKKIGEELGKTFSHIDNQEKFQDIFKKGLLEKPLVLIIDEFDALLEKAINTLVSVFRNIYIKRTDEADKPTERKTYILHAVALIGVRSVLGVENVKGSPFNVQRSLHVPNLDYDEIETMFQWYEKESGQKVEKQVLERLFYETNGQPGLTCWFGELLTEGFKEYTPEKNRPIGIKDFEQVFRAALNLLPNNNIINIISKADQEKYRTTVLELFKTDQTVPFKFDNKKINFLYMNGIIESYREDREEVEDYFVKFSCPFVQKRLFNYFSDMYFTDVRQVVEPFDTLEDAVTEEKLVLVNILKRYQKYLVTNKEWLFKDVPRRVNLRIFEAVFHFNLYMYLEQFLYPSGGKVYPEFPTGNGKIDLLIRYKQKIYGVELKTFDDIRNYKKALVQAALYGKQLGVPEITLVFFIGGIDATNRKKLEKEVRDETTGVTVIPYFIETGNL